MTYLITSNENAITYNVYFKYCCWYVHLKKYDFRPNSNKYTVIIGKLPEPKIQQTKMIVTCQRFGDLFLFGMIWQYSSNHKTSNKGRFKVIATYLQQ